METQYLNLLREVLSSGDERTDRTGVGTLSRFGVQLRCDLSQEFPLLTTKRVFWRGIVEELLWFIRGETDAKILHDKGIFIWDGNTSRQFLDKCGLTDYNEYDCGPVYGHQWRHFGADYKDCKTDYTGQGVDQLAYVISEIKSNPTSRRLVMSSWDPSRLNQMCLPPCHMFSQFYVSNNKLSCQMYQRSADLGLGIPFNMGSYALLTHIIAKECDLGVGEFIHTIGDAHIYKSHIPALESQLEREVRVAPKVYFDKKDIESYKFEDFKLLGYNPHPSIKMDMAV